MRRKLVFALVALVALSCLGCGSTREPSAPDLAARANQRLTGDWVLLSFEPEARLEPMLAALLQAQFGRLVASFDGQTMTALGPGVSTTRRYRVTEAYQDNLKVVLYDEQGVNYSAYGHFVGDRIEFLSLEAPWRGRGVLQRGYR